MPVIDVLSIHTVWFGMAPRLTKARWIEEGLTVLRLDGPSALAADPMAKRLGVSRGSFYWHFESALDFEAAVLGAWEEQWTARIVKAVESAEGPPARRLHNLIQRTGGRDAFIYALAKQMTQKHAELAKLMRTLDDRRVELVCGILKSAGVPAKVAEVRARIVYSWAMGHMVISDEGSAVPKAVADALTAFACEMPAKSN